MHERGCDAIERVWSRSPQASRDPRTSSSMQEQDRACDRLASRRGLLPRPTAAGVQAGWIELPAGHRNSRALGPRRVASGGDVGIQSRPSTKHLCRTVRTDKAQPGPAPQSQPRPLIFDAATAADAKPSFALMRTASQPFGRVSPGIGTTSAFSSRAPVAPKCRHRVPNSVSLTTFGWDLASIPSELWDRDSRSCQACDTRLTQSTGPSLHPPLEAGLRHLYASFQVDDRWRFGRLFADPSGGERHRFKTRDAGSRP